MKKIIILLIITLLYNRTYSQTNLVPNPSFEDTLNCPTGLGDIQASANWFNSGGTADYYNTCADNSTGVSVPLNLGGYQVPYNGNGYAGLVTYALSATPNREFMGTQLTQTLNIGTKYFISVYISTADSFPCICFSDKFGLKFSTIQYNQINPPPIDNLSHIHSDSIISDSIGWVKISGSFVADSAYRYLMIGNFYDDTNTNTSGTCNSSTVAYYYLDQVCVSTDSLECNMNIGINNQSKPFEFSVYPNPSEGIINVDCKHLTEPYDIVVYNSMGQMVYNKSKINYSDTEIDLSNIQSGILYIKISYKDQFYNYKLLKQ